MAVGIFRRLKVKKNEIPVGNIDGSNVIFKVSQMYRPGTTCVFLNGLRQLNGVHYVESGGNQIIMDSPPQIGDNIIVDYVIS